MPSFVNCSNYGLWNCDHSDLRDHSLIPGKMTKQTAARLDFDKIIARFHRTILHRIQYKHLKKKLPTDQKTFRIYRVNCNESH